MTKNEYYSLKKINISTHTLTWSVTTTLKGVAGKETISTHTLTWSVTKNGRVQTAFLCNFNSHAHVERDLLVTKLSVPFSISTHTLTWSVTFNAQQYFTRFNISTHTLTWSVT